MGDGYGKKGHDKQGGSDHRRHVGIATGLARRGARVVIVGRSPERAQAALQDIAEVAGNDQGKFLTADLSLMSSMQHLSEAIRRKDDNLHVLANVGGAMYRDKKMTAEGIERMFAVNDLNHFYLTGQLLDMLKASRPARVITVSGAPRFLRNAKLNLADLQLE